MSATLDALLVQFLRERKYLRNLRPQTLEWYETAWKAFRKSATSCPTDPAALNRSHLEQFVYAVRDRGVRPVTCHTWLRALNAFCRWLHENGHGHAPTRVHIRPLKVEKRLVETLDVEAIRTLVTYKPSTWITVNKKHLNGPRRGQKAFALWRVHALVCTLLDTGCRIDELLTALTASFEQDDLLLTVIGKGDRQRRVLFRYLQTRDRLGINDPLMFPSAASTCSRSAWGCSVSDSTACGTRLQRSICGMVATWCGCHASWAIRRSQTPCVTCRC